ncbi:MAG: ATP-binding protein [Chlamydiae bacterium]|nr:ATP-binding protein [Chlamydiota bacterium]
MKKRPAFKELIVRLNESRKFIQVLLGPRQVGKTTLALQVADEIKMPSHYISADVVTLQNLSWLEEQWEVARHKIDPIKGALLIIDEVQKIPNWAEMIKALWDQDCKNKTNLFVMILGSSPWLAQKGLSESLSGRFEVIPISHWSFQEMKETFHFSLDQYLYFGGYPGASSLIDEKDPTRWKNYINESLIETTISRDILLMSPVHKPALLRRLFQLSCQYSGQILSYSKMLGELQDAGNTTTLAHYLDLLAGAGLICGLQKFANQPFRKRGSSPKLAVFNTALMSAQSTLSYKEAKEDFSFWGRLVESAVGAHLLNAIRGTLIECYYWREQDKEVDFVLQYGHFICAIEVKTGFEKLKQSGMDSFKEKFKPSKIILVGPQGIPLQDFLSIPINNLVGS